MDAVVLARLINLAPILSEDKLARTANLATNLSARLSDFKKKRGGVECLCILLKEIYERFLSV